MPGDILVFNPVNKGPLQPSAGVACCNQDMHKLVHAGVLVAQVLFLIAVPDLTVGGFVASFSQPGQNPLSSIFSFYQWFSKYRSQTRIISIT